MITALLAVLAIGTYLYAVRLYRLRFPDRSFSPWRVAAFCAGTLIIAAALSPPLDVLADRRFSMHMVQHIALTLVGPPLLLLGAPLLLLVAVPPARLARRVTSFAHSGFGQALFAPLTGWIVFVAVLWAAHFSPLYQTALESPPVHVLEHVLFLTAAFLFWGAIVQIGFVPRAVPFPARMLYVFLTIPQGAFLGLAIYASRGVMYPHYAQTLSPGFALADQQNAGAVMWIAGGLFMFIAFMCTGAAWAASERMTTDLMVPKT
ncbi:MAG TPA: cytochrome c oxidase assembly protein [Candidatus Baltobacteraceae bacterium]|jgi:cytochrome c oxidase assembly factor CtaG|nr:cytochrome c oxidase assembly protein [Candidatus Baltobacteraceae bacterium]